MDKAKIKQGIDEYLFGYTPCYFVTLNETRRYSTKESIETASIRLERMAEKLLQWLRERLVGKHRFDDVRATAFFERGKQNGVIHAHIVVAVRGATTRSTDWVNNFVNRKWQQLTQSSHRSQPAAPLTSNQQKLRQAIDLVRNDEILPWEIDLTADSDVRSIDDVRAVVNYSSKDFCFNHAQHQFTSFALY